MTTQLLQLQNAQMKLNTTQHNQIHIQLEQISEQFNVVTMI